MIAALLAAVALAAPAALADTRPVYYGTGGNAATTAVSASITQTRLEVVGTPAAPVSHTAAWIGVYSLCWSSGVQAGIADEGVYWETLERGRYSYHFVKPVVVGQAYAVSMTVAANSDVNVKIDGQTVGTYTSTDRCSMLPQSLIELVGTVAHFGYTVTGIRSSSGPARGGFASPWWEKGSKYQRGRDWFSAAA